MRLREYLEIRDGLKSNLKESNSNDQVDLFDLMRDAYNNRKPASFINDILAAGYHPDNDFDDGYNAREAKIGYFDDVDLDFWLKVDLKGHKDIKDFPELIWDNLTAQLADLGDFKLIQDVKGPAGALYDFYFARLPMIDENLKDAIKDVIAVDKRHNVLYVGLKATDKFTEALNYMVTSNNITTLEDAVNFFLKHYIYIYVTL